MIQSSTNWNTAYTNRITSLTTTGSSGAATLSSNTLNIPNYTLAGLLPSLTNGSVLFSNGTTIAQDNANLFWDDTNKRLGIGTASPTYELVVSKNQNATTGIAISNTTNNTASNVSLIFTTNTAGGSAQIFKYASGRNSYKTIAASDFGHYNATAGDISFLNDFVSGKIKFTSGGVTTTQMTLTAAGRLLLGTTTEGSYILDVNDKVRIKTNLEIKDTLVNAGSGTGLEINTNVSIPRVDFVVSGVYIGQFSCTATDTRFASNLVTSGGIIFDTNNGGGATTKMKITNAGRLLIGTTTESTFILDVSGTARVSGTTTINAQGFVNFTPTNTSDNVFTIKNTKTGTGTGFENACLALDNSATTEPCDIRLGSSNPIGIRVYASNSVLTTSPSGAGFQFYKNASSLPGQIYFDSGAHNSAAIIFRTTVTSGTITERMRIGANGTVSIGTASPNASAITQIDSTTQGFLPPRMTNAQRGAIATPATGLVVYQTDTTEGLYQYLSTGWSVVSGGGGSMAIGGSITSATAGSVLFAGTSGVLAQDNANFFWDDTNNRLGVGTNAPASNIHSVVTSDENIYIDRYNTGTSASILIFRKANGTIASPTALISGDAIGAFTARGHNGTSMSSTSRAAFIGYASENWTSTANGTFVSIFNTANGAASQTERLRLFSTGNLLLQNGGTFTDAGYRLDVAGTTRLNGNLTTNLTLGSVPFISTSGLLAQDNANFFWDNTNKRLGLGTSSPARTLDINGSARIQRDVDTAAVVVQRIGANTKSFIFGVNASAGANNGSFIIADFGAAASGSTYNRILIPNDGAVGLGSSSLNSIGVDLTNAFLSIYNNGNVGIGTNATNAGFKLDVNGTARVTGLITASAGVQYTRLNPTTTTVASTATLTPDISLGDLFTITAQAAALSVANPTGTPVNGQKMTIRIEDNGTARAITWSGTQYRASTDLALPTTTIVLKTMYLGFIYNSTDTKWDLIAFLNNF